MAYRRVLPAALALTVACSPTTTTFRVPAPPPAPATSLKPGCHGTDCAGLATDELAALHRASRSRPPAPRPTSTVRTIAHVRRPTVTATPVRPVRHLRARPHPFVQRTAPVVPRPVPARPGSRVSSRRDSRSDASAAWANTPAARAVVQCESGNDHSAHSSSGTHRGKWQDDADFWRTYGGLAYASSPELATEAHQDAVAYRGFLARSWTPWSCSAIVGVR